MIQAGISLVLGLVMLWAAVTKIRDWKATVAAIAGLGFGRLAAPLAATLTVFYLALAAGLFLRWQPAAWAGAAMMLAAGLFLIYAIARGKTGQPCGCFGARSTVGWMAVIRNAVLAAALIAAATLNREALSTEQWLGLGVIAALSLAGALALAVLALARQVGELQMRAGPGADMALDIQGEGPEPGTRTGLSAPEGSTARFLLAVFVSPGCRVCEGLKPVIETVGSHPAVELLIFGEAEDPDTWERLGVPGSPFAIAMTLDGTVLAKGTFNNAAQLESVLATAERRDAGLEVVA